MYITFCDAPGPGGISTGVVRKFNLTTLNSHNVTPPVGQGGYGGVSVDRQNPNRIVVTTANRWWPTSDIYRSTNGGTNWTAVYNGTVDTSSAPWVGAGGNVVQGWMFDVKIDPYNSNRVFYVTGGGIFSSYNFTATTPTWEFRSTGLEENAFTSIGANLASPPSGPQLWSVLGDMGGFSHYDLDASPALTNFHNPNRANNYGIDFAEQNPHVVVRTYSDFSGERGGYISTNYGSTWSPFPTTPPPAQTDSGPGKVAVSADGTRLVWTIPGFAPYYSTDRGVTWIPCAGSNLSPTESWIEPFCFSDRVNPNKFYLYYRNTGGVFVSTDGGASFALTSTISAWGDSMRPAYGHEGSLWVAVYDGLWRTTNSGASFFKVPGAQAARSVGFGRTATDTGHPVVYLHGQIGGVWGIYRSENQGTNWTRINDNQHQYGNIQQVVGDPKIYGRCYIAAGGRGILYGDIPNQPPLTPTGVIATASNAAVQLSWYNAARADSYIVKRSTTSGSGYTNIATGVTATSYLDTGLVIGTTYYYVVAATNGNGVSLDSAEASAAPDSGPPLWQSQDIGAVGIAGSSLYTNGVFTVSGAGADIQGTADAFQFNYMTVTGDCTIIARVVSVQNVDAWSKAGVMIRADLGANAANAFIAVTPGSGVTWQSRASTGDGTSWNQTPGLSAPYWVKLVRSGNTFTGYRSPNGVTWTPQGTNTFTMASTVYVGLALTSHNTSSLGTATFDNVTVLPGWPVAPAAPAGLTATAGDGSVALNWSASATATNYFVKRSTVSGSGYTTVATNASLTFTNTGLNNGTLYYFVVSALNAYGESTNSAQISARPTSFAPTQLGFATVNNQLQLNWPADHTGWQLQSQTNSLAAGLGTNWVNIAGSPQTNQLLLPMNAADGAVFFRLVNP
jgi:regulation of enolase protein 1 (concanavalin A-like superfamily)